MSGNVNFDRSGSFRDDILVAGAVNPSNLEWRWEAFGSPAAVQAHHIIPIEAFVPAVRTQIQNAAIAANRNFDVNELTNGILLPNSTDAQLLGADDTNPNQRFASMHFGGDGTHEAYSGFARQALTRIANDFQSDGDVSKLFSSIENLQNFLRDGVAGDDPSKILFFLNNDDTIMDSQTRASNVDLDEYYSTRLAGINAETIDWSKPTSIVKLGDWGVGIEQDGLGTRSIASYDSGRWSLELDLLKNGGVSLVAITAFTFAGAGVAKAAVDAGYEETTQGLLNFLSASNLSHLIEQLDVGNIAAQAGAEAAFGLMARLIGGPVSIALNAYDLVENWSLLRASISFTGGIYGEDSIMGQLDNALNEIEVKLTQWFGIGFEERTRDELSLSEIQAQEIADIIEQNTSFSDIPNIELAIQEQFGPTRTLASLSDAERQVLLDDYMQELYLQATSSTLEQQCFLAGTPVMMWPLDPILKPGPDSVYDQDLVRAGLWSKPIEAVTQGDRVLTYDPQGNAVPGVVDKLFANTTQEFLRLEFSDGREDLVSTPGHRFLTETGDYMEIGHMLRLGGGTARVVDVDGSVIEAVGKVIAYSAETANMFEQSATKTIAFEGSSVLKQDVKQGWTTYNFEVREHHNYVAEGIRVHNDSILAALEEGDQLVALNDDLTDAAVLRDVNGDGTADFVTLDGFRRNGEATEVALERVYYWNPASDDLAGLIADQLDNAPDASSAVFDPGAGNNWGDGNFGDDIEEVFFDDILNTQSNGTDRAVIDGLYTTYAFRGIDLAALIESGDVEGSQELIDAISEAATDPSDALAIATFLLTPVGEVRDGPLGLSGVGIVSAALLAWAADGVFDNVPIRIDGTAGDDVLDGTADDNLVLAGAGDDLINGSAGADEINGEGGNDTVSYLGSSSAVVADLGSGGTSGDANGDSYISVENLEGSQFGDDLEGDESSNTISGAGGADILNGRAGDDTLNGGGGDDTLTGGAGSDTADYSDASSRVSLFLQSGGTIGDADGDTYIGIENATGSAFNDLIYGTSGANVIRGGDGVDLLRGEGGDDELFGGDGDDNIRGGDGDDIIHGGAGADDIRGGSGRDTLSYETATSRINIDLRGSGSVGDAAGDVFTSIENIIGSDFSDYIYGNSFNNIIDGGLGNDRLRGHNGQDTMIGGEGDDIIYSGSGLDNIWGGEGSDTFEFRSSNGVNTIHDYADGEDGISIGGGSVFGDLTITMSGSDTHISYASSTIVLIDVDSSLISIDDFTFV